MFVVAVGTTDGFAHNFVDDTQRLQAVGGDGHRVGRVLRAVAGLPQDGGAAFGADHGIDRVLQHQHLVGHRNSQRAPRTTLTNDGGDDRHFQLRHLEDVAANGFGLAAFFGVDTGIGAGRVHKGKHRQFEFLGGLHQPQCLAVPLGFTHAEVAQTTLLGVAPFLVAQHHTGGAVEAGQPAHDAQVVGKMPVAVQFDKVGEQLTHVVQCVRTLGVPGDLGDLPGREVAVDVFGELVALFGQLVDLFRDVDGRLVLHVAQLFDLGFEFGNRLLEVQKCSFCQRISPVYGLRGSGCTTQVRINSPSCTAAPWGVAGICIKPLPAGAQGSAKYTKLQRCSTVPRPRPLRGRRCGSPIHPKNNSG